MKISPKAPEAAFLAMVMIEDLVLRRGPPPDSALAAAEASLPKSFSEIPLYTPAEPYFLPFAHLVRMLGRKKTKSSATVAWRRCAGWRGHPDPHPKQSVYKSTQRPTYARLRTHVTSYEVSIECVSAFRALRELA